MNRRFIKYHPKSNTYVIKKRAYFDEDLVLAGNVIVGQEVNFWKDLKVKGKLDLGRGSVVRGNVKAENALLCSGTRVLGRLDVSSDLLLLDNAKVRAAYCKGDVLVRPGCFMGFIKAEGTLELIGKVKIRDVEPMTKVIVRAEEISRDMSEDTFEYQSEEISRDMSEDMFEYQSEEISRDMSEDLSQDLFEDMCGDIPENISEENLDKDKLWYISEENLVEAKTGDISGDMLEDMSEDIFEEIIGEAKPWYISEDTVENISSDRARNRVNEV